MRYELLFGVQVYGQPVRRVFTHEKDVTIGRGSTAIVRIDDPAMDELHCVISQRTGGRLILQNYGTTRTLLNGKSVKSDSIKTEDTIRCGTTTIKLLECREHPETDGPISGSFKAAVGKISKWARDKRRFHR